MFQYLFFATLVIILICVIYWIFECDKRYREKSKTLIGESAGGFDRPAQEALVALRQIRRPTPGDLFRRGDLIQYNILDGDTQNEQMLDVARDYGNALLGLHIATDIDPMFMIYRIEDFDRNIGGLFGNFHDLVGTQAPIARREVIEQRKAGAVQESATRADAIERCFETAQVYTDDKQNVHDGKVNSDLRDTLTKLKNSVRKDFDVQTSLREIYDYLDEYENQDKVADANRILSRMSRGDAISTYSETEDRILAYTWERCKHPGNFANEKNMKDAIIAALADGVENGNEVCTNGRCSRVLNSLVTLDYDETVGAAMTFEAYRNQIFQEIKVAIEEEIDFAEKSDNAAIRDVAAAYLGDEIIVDPAADAKFKQNMKSQIDKIIARYNTKLTSIEMENISEECYVYATL